MAYYKRVEDVFNDLYQNPDDVVISAMEAAEVWQVFELEPIDSGKLECLAYRAFLQAAMICAIDGSSGMRVVKVLFLAAYKPNATVKKVVQALLKEALKHYFEKKDPGEQLFEAPIRAIAYHNDFYFDAIRQEQGLFAAEAA